MAYTGPERRTSHQEDGKAKRAVIEKTPVDVLVSRQDDTEAVRLSMNAAAKATLLQLAADVEIEIPPLVLDAAEEDRRLGRFKKNYERDYYLQQKFSWEEIKSRLLARNGYYLTLAEGLKESVLFGYDQEGNPLFADGCPSPLEPGLSYKHARNFVCSKWVEGKDVPTGYEMFPAGKELIVSDMLDFTYRGKFQKSNEIKQYEMFTARPFIQPEADEDWSSSWLESGKNPFGACAGNYSDSDGQLIIDVVNRPDDGDRRRGVKRLLRVK